MTRLENYKHSHVVKGCVANGKGCSRAGYNDANTHCILRDSSKQRVPHPGPASRHARAPSYNPPGCPAGTYNSGMNLSLIVSGSHRMLIAPPVGPIIARVQDALDLIGEALSRGATLIVIPVERLDPAFFVLSSGLAGEVTQKIVNYRLKLAVIGDISTQTANSSALRAFVRESNRGRSIFFAQDLESLAAVLSAPRGEDA